MSIQKENSITGIVDKHTSSSLPLGAVPLDNARKEWSRVSQGIVFSKIMIFHKTAVLTHHKNSSPSVNCV